MKNNRILYIVAVFTALITIINISWTTYDTFANDNEVLPEGEFLFSSMSPSGEYTVKIYTANYGINFGQAVRGEAINLNKGEKRNIYWNIGEPNVIVGWIDEHTLDINGIKLNVDTDVYDWREYRQVIK